MNRRAPESGSAQGLDLLLDGGSVLGLGDGPLLDRVTAGPSPTAEAAFDALIRRHGPMVARVCGGIIGDHHTAEDAVQAVFLVLLRRARSIRDPDRLAPWLYGVALRTAREARRRSHVRPSTTLEETPMIDPNADPTRTTIRREQADLLYSAIARLPARYLAPVVLCDLEGLTHAEAAAQLGCPVATVSSRIKRAREHLRTRLARHRLDFETALPPLTTAGLIPRTLAATTAAHLLANRVLWLTATKWKAAVVAALVAGVTAIGAQGNPPDPAPPKPAGLAATERPVDRQAPPEPNATPRPMAATPEVKVGLPIVRNVMDFEEYIGHLAALRTVEIRSPQNGVISSADVAEGNLIRQDQTLFEVADPAFVDRLRKTKARQTELRGKAEKVKAATRNSGDPAEVKINDQLDQLEVELVGLNNEIQTVVAPFAGQITLRSVEVGATVEAGKTVLATVSTVDPIRVDFDMDERTFLKIQRWLRTRSGTTHLPVRVALSDEEGFPHTGRVLFQTARFDPEKGTCTLHAELPNADRALIPGLFAQIQVEYGDPHPAILVPERATFKNNNNPFVVVVDDAGVAHRQKIQTGGLFGELREVKGGIDAKTRIYLVDPEGVASGAKIADPVGTPPR